MGWPKTFSQYCKYGGRATIQQHKTIIKGHKLITTLYLTQSPGNPQKSAEHLLMH